MRLFFLFYSIVMTVLSGIGIVAVLVAGLPGWEPLVVAIAGGAVLAGPVTWLTTRAVARL